MLNDKIIKKAVAEFGTPLYLYDYEAIIASYRDLRAHLPIGIDIFYSLKANPLLGIAQIFKQEGSACEVCSLAELALAQQTGFQSENIIFVGPGKTQAEIEACIAANIYAIVCESLDELKMIQARAAALDRKIAVLLRVNPDFTVDDAPLKMGGRPTQFGFDQESLSQVIAQLAFFQSIQFIGIHIYNATRILNAKSFAENTLKILQYAVNLQSQLQTTFKCLDLGGGLGIPYYAGESQINLIEAMALIKPAYDHYRHQYPQTRLILESGRYLVGASGTLISSVLATKQSHGENFLITDAGMNCHMASTAVGTLMRRNFPIQLIQADNRVALQRQNYHITGPLCTPGDVIARDVVLPQAQLGDYIAIQQVGAYGPSASLGRFLSHGYPAEALSVGSSLYLLKRRETANDILNGQIKLVLHEEGNAYAKY